MIEDRNLVVKKIRIVLVEEKALFESRLIVEVQRKARVVIGARTLEGTTSLPRARRIGHRGPHRSICRLNNPDR